MKLLPKESEAQQEALIKKNVTNEKDYYLSQLPAIVQLAEKMRKRGELVAAGSRIPYIITKVGGIKALQAEKVEDLEYASRHPDFCRPDTLYYIKQLITPVDELLHIVHGVDKFVKNQFKFRQLREKCLDELMCLFRSTIIYQD